MNMSSAAGPSKATAQIELHWLRFIPSPVSAILFLLLCPSLAASQLQTYTAASPDASPEISQLRSKLKLSNKDAEARFWNSVAAHGAPLVEPVLREPSFFFVTFIWHGDSQTRNVVIFDGMAGFDAKDRMVQIDGTNVWYKTYRVRNDARFAYNLSPNDSLQDFNDVHGDDAMHARLAVFRTDPLNPHHCPTTFGAYGAESSYVELPAAPPLVWNTSVAGTPRGMVAETHVHSTALHTDKKIWVYTPPGFTHSHERYPLLVVFDGDRNIQWIPKLLDILTAQGKIPPMVAVMTDESVPAVRNTELPANPTFASFLATEPVPWARRTYFATSSPKHTIVAGSSYGGLASVYAGLKHPEVFDNVIALSGSFWWKSAGEQAPEQLVRLAKSSPKLDLRFYLEVGLMESFPMQIKSNQNMRDALKAKGYPVGYAEFDGGHSFLTWSNGMVNGLEYLALR